MQGPASPSRQGVRFRSRLSEFKKLSVKNCNSIDTQVLAAAPNIHNDSVDSPLAGDKIGGGPQAEHSAGRSTLAPPESRCQSGYSDERFGPGGDDRFF
jgi:hypothetical protein